MPSEHDLTAIGADEFWGFEQNPADLLIEQYQQIAQEEMATLPFYRAEMPIVVEMQQHEGQWLGTVLTPWMLSVVICRGRIRFGLCVNSVSELRFPCRAVT